MVGLQHARRYKMRHNYYWTLVGLNSFRRVFFSFFFLFSKFQVTWWFWFVWGFQVTWLLWVNPPPPRAPNHPELNIWEFDFLKGGHYWSGVRRVRVIGELRAWRDSRTGGGGRHLSEQLPVFGLRTCKYVLWLFFLEGTPLWIIVSHKDSHNFGGSPLETQPEYVSHVAGTTGEASNQAAL